MYEQADLEGNDTFLMNCMVDYKRNEHALNIQDRMIVVRVGHNSNGLLLDCLFAFNGRMA